MYGQDYSSVYQSFAPQLGLQFGNAQMQQVQPTTLQPQPTRIAAGFGNKDKLSNDTSSKDPTLMKSRVFIGNLNTGQCSRNDLIDLCQPYGKLKALSLLKGYAFVQYETQTEAEMAIKILNAYDFYGQKLDVRMAAMGKGSVISTNSNSGPIRRPKHDFLFGGQRIRVETTNVRNRTFSQEVFSAMKDIEFYNHGKDDTMICGSCRSVFSNIKNYIEHRRQKKCNFFEREVAPAVVSCFTCKEEFNESWEFIQHLIHRHSINLYRGQPESDPVSYMEKIKASKKSTDAEMPAETTTETEAPKEPEAPKESENSTEEPKEPEVSKETVEKSKEVEMKKIKQEVVDTNGTETNQSPKEAQSMSPKSLELSNLMQEAMASKNMSPKSTELSNLMREAITSTLYEQSPFSAPPPMTQVSIPMYSQPQFSQPQFSQPQFSQPQFSQPQFSQPLAPNYIQMDPTMYSQHSMAPQVSMPPFVAQTHTASVNQSGLSEEEQMRLLEEFDMDN